ncbi:hypothetical protein BDY19DRAFT_989707 [Irpex rosettiformis]|uniref:Uncharacterized protein n=1 Tax=Irpex rosettiformis TaxID=378272 RepID=A0ACB8UF30_9APHY|nr:hypothetical protein BDY19DRAFT_989707 [Irpex rosettiformis]
MSSSSILSAPLHLWDLYVIYLWDYKPGTWVYRIAQTFWILAFMVLSPFVVLTLLDVASYVIARTLGVVESTRASTGEMPQLSQEQNQQDRRGSGTTSMAVNDNDSDVSSIHVVDPTPSASASNCRLDDEPSSYLHGSVVDEGNLQLAGVDAFSPAPSQPPSPKITRTNLNGSRFSLQPLTDLSGKVGRVRSDSDTSGSKSSEEASGVQMRRRVRDGGDSTDG